MKIRTGFVSNSSSSSFVIWTKDLPPEKISVLKKTLYEMKDGKIFNLENDQDWGESGKQFYIHGNFIEIETYYLGDGWWNFWKELNIPKENIYNIDG